MLRTFWSLNLLNSSFWACISSTLLLIFLEISQVHIPCFMLSIPTLWPACHSSCIYDQKYLAMPLRMLSITIWNNNNGHWRSLCKAFSPLWSWAACCSRTAANLWLVGTSRKTFLSLSHLTFAPSVLRHERYHKFKLAATSTDKTASYSDS